MASSAANSAAHASIVKGEGAGAGAAAGVGAGAGTGGGAAGCRAAGWCAPLPGGAARPGGRASLSPLPRPTLPPEAAAAETGSAEAEAGAAAGRCMHVRKAT